MLTHLDIQNFRGITHLGQELYPASVVLGSNGLGKSSLIDGLATIFGAGGDPADIRNGTKQAVLQVRLSSGYMATKTIKPKKSELVVEDPGGGVMTAPATVLSGFIAKGAFDSKDMLKLVSTEKQDELSEFILKRLPTQVPAAAVNEAVGDNVAAAPYTISQVRALEAAKFKERTGVNSDAEEAKKSLQMLESQVGAEEGTDWGAEYAEAISAVNAIDTELVTLKADLDHDGAEQIAGRRATRDEGVAKIQAEISSLEQQIRDKQAQIVDHNSAFNQYEQRVKTAIAEQFAADSADLNQRKTAAVEKREQAKAKAEAQTKAKGVRELIPAQEARLKGHVTKATRLTTAIENLRELATSAIKNLGIPGLDIIEEGGKQIIVMDAGDSAGAVRVDRLNGQKRVFLAVDLILRAQEAAGSTCRAVVLEGEGLVPSMLKTLADACAARDAQLIVTMPREGQELQVLELSEFLQREKAAA